MSEIIKVALRELIEPRRVKANPQAHPDQSFIGLEHVESHTGRILGRVPAKGMRSTGNKFQKGDVLYSRLRPYLNKVAVADEDGICSSEFIVLPPNEYLNNGFLRHALSSMEFVRFASRLNTGDRPRVDFDQISEYQIPLQTALKQVEIVAKLDELFSDLDAATAAIARVEANLKRYRASVLKSAVEGKLTAEWRAKNPPKESGAQLLERILQERRAKWEETQLAKFKAQGKTPPKDWQKKYPEPVKPDLTKLSALPDGWVWGSLDELLREPLRNGFSARETLDGKTPIISISAVTANEFEPQHLKLTDANLNRVRDLWMVNEDIFIQRSNTPELVGSSALYRGANNWAVFPDLLIRVRTITLIPSEFVAHCLKSVTARSHMYKRAQGSAGSMPKIDQDAIRTIPIPIPPAVEMATLLALLSEALNDIKLADAILIKRRANVTGVRQSILKYAFEGKLVPQDPNDEPASELLKRIRAEQESRPPKDKPAKTNHKATGKRAAKRKSKP